MYKEDCTYFFYIVYVSCKGKAILETFINFNNQD